METATPSSTPSTTRGSARLFSLAPDDHEGIARALGLARNTYEVKWWWKYGQPAIDRIKAQFEVPAVQLGAAVNSLMQLNGRELQVTAECFPYGLPKPDVFRVEVDINQSV